MPFPSHSDLLSRVQTLPAGHPSTWDVEQTGEAIPELVALENQVVALKLAAIARFDAGDGARADGSRTTGDWLRKKTRMTNPGGAVHTARDLRDVLPVTAEALAAGLISVEQVALIRGAMRWFDDFTEIEPILVEHAKISTASELRTMVELLKQQYAPDGTEEDAEAARERRELFLSQGLGGWWHLKGMLDPASGEKLKRALEVFSERCGPDDDRDAPARRVDGLIEMAERAMDPHATGHGHLTLVLTPEQAESKLGVEWPTGMVASRTDASVELCATEVTYVVGYRNEVTWEPLAAGYAHRFATPAQRRALAVRDGSGCAHPGCTVQDWRCVAHHIIPWDQGGPTEIANLVLLCRFHHREVHRGKLRVVFQQGRATTILSNAEP